MKEEEYIINAIKELTMFEETCLCAICTKKVQVVRRILEDIVILYRKAYDFIEFAQNSPYLRLLEEVKDEAYESKDNTIESKT